MGENLEKKIDNKAGGRRGFLDAIKDFFSPSNRIIMPIALAIGLLSYGREARAVSKYEHKLEEDKAQAERVHDSAELHNLIEKQGGIYVKSYYSGRKSDVALDPDNAKEISFGPSKDEVIYKEAETYKKYNLVPAKGMGFPIGKDMSILPTSETAEKYYSVKNDYKGRYSQKTEITKEEYLQKKNARAEAQKIEYDYGAPKAGQKRGIESEVENVNLAMLLALALSFFIFSGVSITGYSTAELNAVSVISYYALSLIGALYLFAAIVIFSFRQLRR